MGFNVFFDNQKPPGSKRPDYKGNGRINATALEYILERVKAGDEDIDLDIVGWKKQGKNGPYQSFEINMPWQVAKERREAEESGGGRRDDRDGRGRDSRDDRSRGWNDRRPSRDDDRGRDDDRRDTRSRDDDRGDPPARGRDDRDDDRGRSTSSRDRDPPTRNRDDDRDRPQRASSDERRRPRDDVDGDEVPF